MHMLTPQIRLEPQDFRKLLIKKKMECWFKPYNLRSLFNDYPRDNYRKNSIISPLRTKTVIIPQGDIEVYYCHHCC